MSRSPDIDTFAITGAVFTGLVAALATYWILSALSTPPRLKARMDLIETGIGQVEASARRPSISNVYLHHALCHGPSSAAQEVVRTELSNAASEAGLSGAQIALTPASEADMSQRAYPVLFDVEATDRYDLVLGYLQRLASAEPQIFADTIDLTSKTSAVSLKITGRVLCEPGS